MWRCASCSKNAQQGMALVTALLYLLVVTLLVVCAFSTSALQTKISTHITQEKQAFEYAESALLVGEDKISFAKEAGEGRISDKATYKFYKLAKAECGIFFQVDAIGNVAAAKVHLQSIFILLADPPPKSCLDPLLTSHRVIWRQLNE